MDKPLADFLEAHHPLAVEDVVWGNGRYPLHIRGFYTTAIPPRPYLMSARSIVFREDKVMVVADPDGLHIVPGGRIEEGETLWQTTQREVGEESGWLIERPQMLGFLHYRHLADRAAVPFPLYPDFLQVVYLSHAYAYNADLLDEESPELWAKFYSIDEVYQLIDSPVQLALLQNAIDLLVQ
ncbi:MAG: NUDIX hydrolase [Anaerolineales bacterium]|nr:NUDIX hydrolase [Anaerolineales bacterium]